MSGDERGVSAKTEPGATVSIDRDSAIWICAGPSRERAYRRGIVALPLTRADRAQGLMTKRVAE